MKSIGCNFVSGFKMGAVNSSFNGKFDKEEVLIENDLSNIVPCKIGDIKECYDLLDSKLYKYDNKSLEAYSFAIQETINEYFGDYSNIEERLSYYPDEDSLPSDEEERENQIGKICNLKGKNAAMCIERAMLAQNLLQHVGINSFFKCSSILNNDKKEVHAYNLINSNDKYYIFDATIPTLRNNEISPLICEIPEDTFKKISNPAPLIGCAVEVDHYAPLTQVQKHLIYDADRREKIYGLDLETPKNNIRPKETGLSLERIAEGVSSVNPIELMEVRENSDERDE